MRDVDWVVLIWVNTNRDFKKEKKTDLSALIRLRKEKVKWKKNILLVVRVRVELTTLALSAPRSADWANGPAVVEVAELYVHIKESPRVFKSSVQEPLNS